MLFYHLRAYCLPSILILTTLSTVHADTLLWSDAGNSASQHDRATQAHMPSPASARHYRQWHADTTQLRELLARDTDTLSLTLPLADGTQTRVTATRTQVLAPALAARYPAIRTWEFRGQQNPAINGVMTFGQYGLNATVNMPDHDRVLITPVIAPSSHRTTYRSISQRNNAHAQPKDWSCATHGTHDTHNARFSKAVPASSDGQSSQTSDRRNGALRTYRLAITATASYTKVHGNGTKAGALSAIAAAVNQINFIYKRDLGIRFQLVADNDKLIYTTTDTSPFDESNLRSTMLRNQTVIDQTIGNSQYDIGHVFNGSGGGIAYVGSTCQNNDKAKGATGLGSQASDSLFAIDYAAHELGHQLAAKHTFNSINGACSGGREANNAFEPGSGNTIMAYAGLCAGDNLGHRSLPQFHSKSIEQITRFIEQEAGLTCGIKHTTDNQNPDVNAGADYTIPANTPFTLSALTATDSDGDTLLYSWEQIDAGQHATVHVDTSDNAIIRTTSLSTTPQRSIPPVDELITDTVSIGEILPAASRTLNFRLQARDQQGGLAHDDLRLNVHSTGSTFAITYPQHSGQIIANSLLAVEWQVANTHLAPIQCHHVDIAVTDNGGERFTHLIRRTPNDGSETVTLPAQLGNYATIRVKCSNNIFFALSDTKPPVAKHVTNDSGGNDGSDDDTADDTGSNNTNNSQGGGGHLGGYGVLLLLLLTGLRRCINHHTL